MTFRESHFSHREGSSEPGAEKSPISAQTGWSDVEEDAGDRESQKPHRSLALLRLTLQQSPVYQDAIHDVAEQRNQAPRDSAFSRAEAWGFCGNRKKVLAELLVHDAANWLKGLSENVLATWSVAEPNSPRGKYLTEGGRHLRVRGAIHIASDVENLCRLCGNSLGARRQPGWADRPHELRIRYCAECDLAHGSTEQKGVEKAIGTVLAEVAEALQWPRTRRARTEQRITVELR